MNNRSMILDDREEQRRRREENIVWTVSESYDYTPPTVLQVRTEIEELDFIRLVFWGTLYYEQIGRNIEAYLIYKKNQVEAYELVWEVFCLTLEMRQLKVWRDRRTVFSKYYKDAVKKTVEYYNGRPPKEITGELRNAVYRLQLNLVAKTTKQVKNLAVKILNMPYLEEKEWILYLEELLGTYFHFNSEFSYSVEENQKVWHEISSVKKRYFLEGDKKESYQDIVQIASAEFNPNDFGDRETTAYEKDMKEDLSISSAGRSNMKREIIKYYGESLLRPHEEKNMELKICTTLHKGCKVHVTKDFMNVSDSYRKKKLLEQRRENIEHYEGSHRIYRRNILRLHEFLEQAILPDQDESDNRTDKGRLLSGEVWKNTYLYESKVFLKPLRDLKGEFQVDLILDSSGSQMERQSRVATQGYIIAEALSLCRIPVRISSFQTLFDYTVIKRYRDYEDDRINNRNIFYYMSEGSNRDGLALRAMEHMMDLKEGKKRIVIVLSDGRPNDVRTTKMTSLFVSQVKDYTGREAVRDTALEIRKLRQKDMAVLGVFTGEREDMEAEKMIFGKDFAYIQNIERFSDVVGKYLKLQIREHLESE